MNHLTSVFGGLFSLSGLIAFMLGVLGTRLYYLLQERWQDRCDPAHRPHHVRLRSLTLLWALIFIITGYIGIQQQQTANQVRQLSADTSACQKEFFTVLKARAQSNDQTDEWSREKTFAISSWLRDILFPPADMLALREKSPPDPLYTQWVIDTTSKYLNQIDTLEKAQETSLSDRAAHPLPEPSCGR